MGGYCPFKTIPHWNIENVIEEVLETAVTKYYLYNGNYAIETIRLYNREMIIRNSIYEFNDRQL